MEPTAHVEEILTGWGIDPTANWQVIQANVSRITLTDGRQFVLKDLGLQNEVTLQRLHFEREVLQHVARRGLSVAVPLPTNQGFPYVIAADHIYRLSHWLPNQPAQVQTSEDQIRLYQNYGAAIGRFHQALASYEADNLSNRTWQTNLQKRVLEEAVPVVLAHLAQALLPTFQTCLAEIEPELTQAYAHLPVQLIIWDCHPGNVAVDGFEVSGFIDCDHISIAPRIFDLADFMIHLLKWDIGDEQKADRWLAHFQHIAAGYQSVTRLSGPEQAALFYAMVGIPLIFMDFFFQSGLPELTKIEFDTFVWLVRHQQAITAQLQK